MHPDRVGASRAHAIGEPVERLFRVLLVDADPALYGDRNRDAPLHRINTCADQFRLAHQARAESPRLHAVRWAADIQVDLVITERLADLRRLGEAARLRAAELQRDRMLLVMKADQPLAIA